MTKHETREYAFLLLYEAMVRAEELTTIEDLYASTEEMLELPVPEKVKQYVSGVMSQTEELDNIISEYSKQRSLNRVPAVNRSILRLALYELKNLPQTPVNVVISEAVHLSQYRVWRSASRSCATSHHIRYTLPLSQAPGL